MMQPPLQVSVEGNGGQGETLAAIIKASAGTIKLWIDTHQPSPDGRTLWFDLTTMSNLTRQPMPLLRLRQLILEMKNVARA